MPGVRKLGAILILQELQNKMTHKGQHGPENCLEGGEICL